MFVEQQRAKLHRRGLCNRLGADEMAHQLRWVGRIVGQLAGVHSQDWYTQNLCCLAKCRMGLLAVQCSQRGDIGPRQACLCQACVDQLKYLIVLSARTKANARYDVG